MFTLLMSVVMINAQTAIQTSNALDNISVGITGGVSTPLDFNSMFPLNTNVGLKIQKDFTPEFGLQAEGVAFLNNNHFNDLKTTVKATNVGLNGVLNLSNIFSGYKGSPRVFEINTVAGLGWLYNWNTSISNLSAKTGLDLAFNFGKGHSIVITPAVYWNLNKLSDITFNKHHAQLAVNLSYVYHFKTSNGTHYFKFYDIGALNDEITRLRAEVENKPEKVVTYVDKPVEVISNILVKDEYIVFFSHDSYVLDESSKRLLNEIPEGTIVSIIGLASPEGTPEHNIQLSQNRADVVKQYLENRGVNVESAEGLGVQGPATNRVAIVRIKN